MSDFTFNASALGVGGIIDHADGKRTVISSLASVALAPSGGEGASVVENYSNHGISFARAESRVAGYETSCNHFTTYTDVYVTGLSVFDRFKVALMQVTMTSTRYLPPGTDPNQTDSTFDLRAIYRGVELDGAEIIPSIDLDLCSAADYDQFARTMLSSDRYAKKLGIREENPFEALTKKLRVREPIVGSIVSELDCRHKGVEARGNKLDVPDFGSIRFGEFLVKPGRRRINLLRFVFGEERPCIEEQQPEGAPKMFMAKALTTGGPGDSGSLTVGSGDGNGVPIWPH
jgi:hypothetical protein